MQTIDDMLRRALLGIAITVCAGCNDDSDFVLECSDCPPGAIRAGRLFDSRFLAAANASGDVVLAGFNHDRITWLAPDLSVAREVEVSAGGWGIRLLSVDDAGAVAFASGEAVVVLHPDGSEQLRVSVSDLPAAIALGREQLSIAAGADELVIAGQPFRDGIITFDRADGHVVWTTAIPDIEFSILHTPRISMQALPSGELLVGGRFRGTLALGGTAQPLESPSNAGFVAMLDRAGLARWAESLMADSEESSAAVTVVAHDGRGNLAITAWLWGPAVLAGTPIDGMGSRQLAAQLDSDGTLHQVQFEREQRGRWSSVATDGSAVAVGSGSLIGSVPGVWLLGDGGWGTSCYNNDLWGSIDVNVLAVTERSVLATIQNNPYDGAMIVCGDMEYHGRNFHAVVELVR